MIRLAWRNLFQNPVRLVVSVGGVGLALMLILALDAIVAGMQTQVTAFIDHSNADIFVSQENVRNMHMAYSALRGSVLSQVRNIEGVESATPILYLTNLIEIGSQQNSAYVIGLPNDPSAGGPWRIVEGKGLPAKGEAIIDRGIALRAGAGLGDTVKILGKEFRIAGLSEGTASISGGSVAFISSKDWTFLQAGAPTISFVLVRVRDGESAAEVARRIESRLDKVTAQTREQFASQERQVVGDMSTDIITIMNLIGFAIGLAVMALTIYTAMLARRAEFGVLKALGARNGHLYRVVLTHALLSVLLGLGLGLGFTFALELFAPRLGLGLALQVGGEAVAKVSAVSAAIAGLSALLPVRQIAGLDPAVVFRGR